MPSQGATLNKVAAVPGAINLDADNLAGTDIASISNGGPQSAQATLDALAAFWGIVPLGYQSRIVTTNAEAVVEPNDVAIFVEKTVPSPTTFLLLDPIIREHDDGTFLGRTLIFKDMAGNATSYPITLDAGAGNTINGSQTLVLDSNYAAVILLGESDTQWGIVVQEEGPTAQPRTKLLVDTTFNVNANTGNDANNGLTPGTAKQTIEAMVTDLYENYDAGGFNVVIQLTGHFTAGFEIHKFLVGQSTFTIQGNPLDVTAVRIDLASINKCARMFGGNILLQDVTLSNTGGGDAIYVDEIGFLTLGNIRFEDVDGQMIFCGGGGHIFVNTNKTITVAGSGQVFVHHTGMSEVSFEDCFINYIQNPISGNYPAWSIYLYGGNNSTLTFNRAVITGQFSGCITEHFAGVIKNSPTSGSIFPTFYAVGIPTNVIDSGGAIYTIPSQPNTYVGLTGDNKSEGFSAAYPVLDFFNTMALMAKRYTSNQVNAPPVMQVADNSYPASIVLLDIPGCPLAYCRGNPTTPGNCTLRAIQSRAVNTYWILDGFTFNNAGDENIHVNSNAQVGIQNCVFQLAGPSNSMITVDQGGFIEALGPVSITGGAASFINNNGGQVIITPTVNIFNAIIFGTATVIGNSAGKTRWTGAKVLNGGATVTATRVNLKNLAFLDSNNTTDQTSIPGSVDGPVDAGTFALMV